jgi:DNA repair protein RecO
MPLAADTAPLILRTEAIVLRVSPFSRTSHVVTWLSPTHGRLSTVVKGACRPKSAFLGQYDLFATCELLFYRREHDGMHAIRECSPLTPRDGLRTDWRRITTAGYLCDLAGRVAQPEQESENVYALLQETLDALLASPPTPDDILRFELALLRHLGLLPAFAPCPACHTAAHPWLRFVLGAGRAHCAHTLPPAAGEPVVTVHRDVLLRLADLAGDATGAAPADPHPHLSLGSRRFLGIFMRFHLDTPPAPRRLAFELLETDPAAIGTAKGEPR